LFALSVAFFFANTTFALMDLSLAFFCNSFCLSAIRRRSAFLLFSWWLARPPFATKSLLIAVSVVCRRPANSALSRLITGILDKARPNEPHMPVFKVFIVATHFACFVLTFAWHLAAAELS